MKPSTAFVHIIQVALLAATQKPLGLMIWSATISGATSRTTSRMIAKILDYLPRSQQPASADSDHI